MSNKLICLVGMCGSGKSEAAEYLKKKRDFGYVRFGQITLDKFIQLNEKPTEAREKEIREGLRKEHGMAAFAILNIPKFDALLEKGDVIGDGLYSWEEYLVLKDRYGDDLVVLAVYASPATRYLRLEGRGEKHGEDKNLRFRSFTREEAASRDKAEIENINKAGPIAMADFTILNENSIESLSSQVDEILKKIYS